jgi:hypothetical protein
MKSYNIQWEEYHDKELFFKMREEIVELNKPLEGLSLVEFTFYHAPPALNPIPEDFRI